MAAGQYRIKIKSYTLAPQIGVQVGFEYGLEAADGTVPERTSDTESYTDAEGTSSWATFWNSLTASEKTALGSIDAKIKAYIKSKVAKLATAQDIT